MSCRKSDVWEFYDICQDNNKFAKCKICDIQISRGGTGRKASTTSLINHLNRTHNDDYEEFQREKSTNASTSKNTENIENIVPIPTKQTKQQTLLEVVNKSKKWDTSDKRAISLNYAVAEMIALDNMPFSTVENTGFRRLMNKVAPNYVLPDRHVLSDKIIPEIHNRVVDAIKNKMTTENAKYISFTSDIWTCENTTESFISFTGHWIDHSFQYNHLVLNCRHFPGSHTGEAIRDMILEMLQVWNIDRSRVHILIRDNAANLVKGCNDANIKSVSCFIHTLQLVILEGLKSQRSLTDLIASCRKLVGHFRHSSKACSALKNIQTELSVPQRKLVQDVQTRWNSTFYMLRRILDEKRALTVYCADNNLEPLNLNQWTLIGSLVNLLEPFEEITRAMSLNLALISEVIPTITTLLKFLSKEQELLFFGVGTMKQLLCEEIKRRFDSTFKNKHYIISTILDPRFKLMFFEKDQVDQMKLVAINEYEYVSDIATPESDLSGDDSDEDVPLSKMMRMMPESNLNTDKKENIWDCFDKIAVGSSTQPQKK